MLYSISGVSTSVTGAMKYESMLHLGSWLRKACPTATASAERIKEAVVTPLDDDHLRADIEEAPPLACAPASPIPSLSVQPMDDGQI